MSCVTDSASCICRQINCTHSCSRVSAAHLSSGYPIFPTFHRLSPLTASDMNHRSILRALTCDGEPVRIYDGNEPLLEETPTEWTTCRSTVILLNRPNALNALTKDMLSGLYHRIKYLDRTPGFKAIIMKGRGRAFCAGGDLTFLRRDGHGGQGNFNDVD